MNCDGTLEYGMLEYLNRNRNRKQPQPQPQPNFITASLSTIAIVFNRNANSNTNRNTCRNVKRNSKQQNFKC